jgi:hypothetical protein
MRRTVLSLGLAVLIAAVIGCDPLLNNVIPDVLDGLGGVQEGVTGSYANTAEGDVGIPHANGPNPANLPNANHVPKPDAPPGYAAGVTPVTIDEVFLSGQQWTELFNATSLAVDIGGWTLADGAHEFTFPYGFTLQPGGRVVVHLGQYGISNEMNLYAPSFGALSAAEGSMALLHAGGELMHFVQWGNINQAFEGAAAQIGIWPAGDYVDSPPLGLSLAFDGSENTSSAWHHTAPSPGSPN